MKNRSAILALVAAGSLWGVTVALSKLSLRWLDPSWLTAARFLAAAPMLAFIGRRGLRQAFTPRILVSGSVGYGAVVLLQNVGIDHTSVSHGAIIVGALPVVVALVAVALGQGSSRPLVWIGYAVALVGIVLVAKGGGGGATDSGDMLVFASVVLSGAFIAVQPGLLRGRNAAAVTAVQFLAAELVSLPVALLGSPLPHAPSTAGPGRGLCRAGAGRHDPSVLAVRLRPGSGRPGAGRRLREPRAVGRGDRRLGRVLHPVGPWQIVGALTVIAGILLSLLPPELELGLPRVQRAIEAALAGTRRTW